MAIYEPPKQSTAGQIVDSIFLLALVYVALLIPLFIDFGGEGGAEEAAVENVALTWESLGQNETMQAQWEGLGVGIEDAAAIINDKFDYTIDPVSLILTALVIIGYFFLLFRYSDKEYKEVLKEKFGED